MEVMEEDRASAAGSWVRLELERSNTELVKLQTDALGEKGLNPIAKVQARHRGKAARRQSAKLRSAIAEENAAKALEVRRAKAVADAIALEETAVKRALAAHLLTVVINAVDMAQRAAEDATHLFGEYFCVFFDS